MNKILVTGCSGLVGVHLIKKLIKKGYDVYGIDIFKHPELEHFKFSFIEQDLCDLDKLNAIFKKENFDVVLNTFGVKGSPLKAKTNPVDFLYPTIKINNEIINLCAKINAYLVYVSSIGVYGPAESFIESDVWKTLPSENDWFPSWSKRVGEILLEAHKIQSDYKKWSIIRPANIFGEYEKFDGQGTVISSVVKKVGQSFDKILCWGDGTPIRDFVYAGDVADAIIKLFENELNIIINFGSGIEVTISEIVNKIIKISKKEIEIIWDNSKPNGDIKRLMDISLQKKYNLLPNTNLEDALVKTYEYFIENFYEVKSNYTDFLLENGFYIGLTKDLFPLQDKHLEMLKKLYDIPKSPETYYACYELINVVEKDFKISSNKMLLNQTYRFDDYVKENNKENQVFQKWYHLREDEPSIKDNVVFLKQYFRKAIEKFIHEIYPDLKNNITHMDNFTLYENGHFIAPHRDGLNEGRKCVVLIYLSEKYEDGGGFLVIEENEEKIYIEPYIENFVILDFSKHNINHSVGEVKNNFKRHTYIDFVYNTKEYEDNIIKNNLEK